jgi:hypothetical protein
MKNEIRSLTENEVDDVSGAVIPAWLAVLAEGVATNAIYDWPQRGRRVRADRLAGNAGRLTSHGRGRAAVIGPVSLPSPTLS